VQPVDTDTQADNDNDNDNGALAAPATRRRVLLLIKGLGAGGAERLLLNMVRQRDRQRFDYEVAYILEDSNSLVPELIDAGVAVHSLGAASNHDLGWTGRLHTLLRQGDFDLMHSHLPYAATLGRIVAAASMTPRRRPALVYTEHSMWNKMAVAIKALNRATIGLDDRLLIISQAAKESLPPALRRRATVVIHGIEMEPVHRARAARESARPEVRREFGLSDGELLVLTVANLRPEKANDVLLRSARTMLDRGAPIRFLVAGTGPLRDELESQRTALGLGDHFRFLGERSDILRLLSAADLFVLPSRQEGLPVVLMEAAAMGVPIVVTRVGEIPNLWTEGLDALIVPPEDPDALVDAISALAGDAELRQRLAAGSLQRSTLFDATRFVRQVEGIYDELVPAGPGRGGRQ
jgi:glycosyltransferase involved in cell wall biosynthesis